MKKIMIMTNGLYSGGEEKVLQTVLNNLDYSKFDVTLFSMHREELDPEIFRTQDKYKYKTVFGCSVKPAFLGSFLAKVKGKLFNLCPPKIFRLLYLREKFDVEIAFLEGEPTKIVSGSLNKKCRKLAWVHTDMIVNNWTDYLYKNTEQERDAYLKFDEIFCVSESVKEAFIKKYRIENNVSVKYNPVDSADILEKSREKSGLENEKRPLIISVGRLEKPKGYPRLVKCANRLRQEGYEFTLAIAGDGRQRESIEQYIDENDLSDTVKLLGFHDNPYKFIAEADGFICSSYIEGFSTAATESIILGKPVYTVDCPGMKELFANEQCGIILPNTTRDLYLLLKHAIVDEKSREKYTAAAKRRAEFFDIKARMDDIESVI